MNVYTKELVELSKIDNNIDSFRPQIEQIDKKVKLASNKVTKLEAKKDEINSLIESNSISITSLEEQIKDLKDKLEDVKKKSAAAKKERDFASVSSEEHIAKETLAYNNDEIERLNSITETKSKELEELESELAEAKNQYQEIEESVKSEYDSIEESKTSLYQERDEKIRSMDSKILAFYEKIKNWAGNSAVVKVEKQACYGCYIKINDKTYADLIKGEEIVSCPHCGRVLYIEVDKESIEA